MGSFFVPYATHAAHDERHGVALATIAGAVLSLTMLAGLRWPILWLGCAAVLAGVGLLWSVRYTTLHPLWLPFALMLIEVLPSANFIDESIRPFLRYPLLVLFCAPVFPRQWKGTMLSRGGFGLYVFYFALALLSVGYSIAPSYSLGRVVGSVLIFGALYRVSQEIRNEHDVRLIFGIYWGACSVILIALAASFVVLPSSITWALPDQWSHDSVVRFVGILGAPNQVGEVALPAVGCGLLFWPIASARTRLAIVASIGAAIMFAVLADSRSSLAAITIGLFCFSAYHYRSRAIAAWVLLFALAIAGLFTIGKDKLEYVNRGDVSTLTGRTEVWRFTLEKIKESPLLGYGYEVEGQIFQDRRFPLWEEMWDQGPHIAIHSGYLARAVGLGVPSLLLWLFMTLRPLVGVFRKVPDRFQIRDAILLGAVPILILNIDESASSDCRYSVGLLLALIWCIAERTRLMAQERNPDSKSAVKTNRIELLPVTRLARAK